jgi:hypothetical protein
MTRTAREQAADILKRMVVDQVTPYEWSEGGNSDGAFSVVGGALVVSQTESSLHQISDLLGELESKMGAIDARANQE